MIYKFANLQKFLSSGSNYFKCPNRALWITLQTDDLTEFGLTVTYLCNAISPQIVAVKWCMSSILQCKVYGALGSIRCPGLSLEKIVAIIRIFLSGLV
jgi:hypothetical protein